MTQSPNVPIVGAASGERKALIRRSPVANHLQRYPNARTTTLAHLIEREKKSEQLRREVAASQPWLKRVLMAVLRKVT